MWRTTSRQEVETYFDTRVNTTGRSLDDENGFFTGEQLKQHGYVVPETPGDPAEHMTKKLPHHSVRPGVNPNAATKLTVDEIKALDEGLKSIQTRVIKPKQVRC